ncbi:MAG: elongation factor G [Clostridiales bacterium]|nr:elongation factor G [Clostridiales bacterium]
MAKFETGSIRNIALLGHGGCGKTSLAEAMLYISGGTDRLGKTSDGNTVCDFDPEEIKRSFSISTAIAPVIWKGTKLNVLDTPGYLDFVGEVKQALRVAGSAVILVDAKSGVEVGTELAWDYAAEVGVPTVFFINKYDDNEANFDRVFDQLKEKFGSSVCPVVVPVKSGKDIQFVDLIDMKAFKCDAKGAKVEIAMTPELEAAAESHKADFNDAIAMVNEDIMMKVLEEEEITREEAAAAIHDGIVSGTIVPVYCGSSTTLAGITEMMDAAVSAFPKFTSKGKVALEDGKEAKVDPAGPAAIFVFKTVADPFVGKMSYFKVMNGTLKRDMSLKNLTTGVTEKMSHIYTLKGKNQTEVDELACGDIGMIAKLSNTNTNNTLRESGDEKYAPTVYPVPNMTQAMIPETAKDEGKISQSMARMVEEDLTLKYETDPDTKQMIISGLGDMHLAILAAKLKNRYGVSIKLAMPKIAYREKITKTVDIHGRHKKQNGGSGQFGDVWIKFSPGEAEGLTFTVSVVGGVVPKNFNPAVEKGLLEAMQKGAAGFPMTHLAADLHDGSYHPVDSDEISFKTAAQLAYKQCLLEAAPVILEPVGELDITVPESLVGDVMGDLNKRRGSIMGMDAAKKKGYTVVHAIAPKAEIMDYPIALRAMSQGRGSFTFKVNDYATVPGNIAQKIIEDYKKSQDA